MDEETIEAIKEMRRLAIEISIKYEELKLKGFSPEDFQAFKKKIDGRLASIERIVTLRNRLAEIENAGK